MPPLHPHGGQTESCPTVPWQFLYALTETITRNYISSGSGDWVAPTAQQPDSRTGANE